MAPGSRQSPGVASIPGKKSRLKPQRPVAITEEFSMSDQVPKIKRVGPIVLYVADPARSAQWYCDVLGMIQVVELKDGPYKGAVFLSFGVQDHDIGLFPG